MMISVPKFECVKLTNTKEHPFSVLLMQKCGPQNFFFNFTGFINPPAKQNNNRA